MSGTQCVQVPRHHKLFGCGISWVNAPVRVPSLMRPHGRPLLQHAMLDRERLMLLRSVCGRLRGTCFDENRCLRRVAAMGPMVGRRKALGLARRRVFSRERPPRACVGKAPFLGVVCPRDPAKTTQQLWRNACCRAHRIRSPSLPFRMSSRPSIARACQALQLQFAEQFGERVLALYCVSSPVGSLLGHSPLVRSIAHLGRPHRRCTRRGCQPPCVSAYGPLLVRR